MFFKSTNSLSEFPWKYGEEEVLFDFAEKKAIGFSFLV